MTEDNLRRLVTEWASRLGLNAWDLHVEVKQLDDDTSAQTHRSRTYDAATITFQPWMAGHGDYPTDWPGRPWDDAEIEKTVVHELLHCCCRDLKHASVDPLDGQLHRDVLQVWEAGVYKAEEKVVARLADALVNAWHNGQDDGDGDQNDDE